MPANGAAGLRDALEEAFKRLAFAVELIKICL